MKFRDYQEDIITKGSEILRKHGFVYLSMEVRTGKTLTALGIADECERTKMLFVTKKKAIHSIESDYAMLNPGYDIEVINYESLHKADVNGIDVLVIDEAHRIGAFPKPNKAAKQLRELILRQSPHVIFLSGTPTPESFSQMYHQVYGIPGNPFSQYKNFYRFADDHVNKTTKKINGFNINDYSDGKESIIKAMDPYMIPYTQKQAGFEVEVEEDFIEVPLDPVVKAIIKRLKRDRVVEGSDSGEVILADTGAKMMGKVHQLCSGTVIFESGNTKIFSLNKAKAIKWKFDSDKIGIFYKFTAELDALKQVFGDSLTTDIEEFNTTDKHIALQIQSGREGISLKAADYLVFYNIDFSATSYWQARDRMTTKHRNYNKVFWVFSIGGIERKIYKAVVEKKNYTLRHFKRDLLIK